MVEPQATRFWQSATRSGLIDAVALEACWERVPPAKRTPEAAERRLARQAVDAGYLTLWQAQQLLGGRASGYKIDKYILLDRIGTGGMGRVYLARDTRLGRRVALKILAPDRLSNPRAVARFHREAKVGAQLQHENLVRVYDVGEAGGAPYLVMELIAGKTINKLIAEAGRLAPGLAAGLARQVALGLEHAYQKGLIHRDVNPMNIMVTPDGVAKLTDLGLALDTGEGDGELTREGLTVGTFDYISPEQARHSRNVDTRTDIYSLGCSLYHMIAGHVPFPMPSLPEKLYAHQVAEPEPLSRLVPGVPEGLDAVVRRMMHKTTDGRYPTPLAVAMALEPFQGAAPLPGPAAPTGPVADPPSPPTSAGEPAGDAEADVFEGSDFELANSARAPAAGGVGPAGTDLAAPGPGPGGPDVTPHAASPPATAPARVEDDSDVIEIDDEPELGSLPVARAAPAPPGRAAAQLRDVEFGPGPAPVVGSDAFLVPPPVRPPAGASRATPPSSTDIAADFDSILPGSGTRIEPLREAPARARAGRRAVNVVALLLISALSAYVLYRGIGRFIASMPTHKSTVPDDGRGKGLQLPKGASIAVRLPDGSKPPAADLAEALALVAPGGGEVVIDGPKFLKVEAPITLAKGKVVLRAAAAGRPAIVTLELDAGPWLKGASGGSLAIENLTVAVALLKRPGTALIEADGALDVRRCLFMGMDAGPEARALVARGPKTTVEGCGFRGFDRPVELDLDAGADADLTQCLMAWSQGDAHKTGWAVRVRPRGGPGRRGLSLDHCTIAGGGPIEVLGGFSAELPLAVKVQNTAILADAMIQWGPPAKAFPRAIPWQGKGNRYNIQKVAWVVLPPNGFSGLPDGPTDPSAWEKALPESGLVAKSFRFAVGDSAETLLRPADYALTDKDAGGVGADPTRVGPPEAGR